MMANFDRVVSFRMLAQKRVCRPWCGEYLQKGSWFCGNLKSTLTSFQATGLFVLLGCLHSLGCRVNEEDFCHEWS